MGPTLGRNIPRFPPLFTLVRGRELLRSSNAQFYIAPVLRLRASVANTGCLRGLSSLSQLPHKYPSDAAYGMAAPSDRTGAMGCLHDLRPASPRRAVTFSTDKHDAIHRS